MEKDAWITGLVVGAILPVVGFYLMENLLELMAIKGTLAEATGESMMRRMRTIGLIAICFNLIPFEVCRKYRYDQTMRGIVLPTLVYVGFWIYKYYYILFS
ncbi:MAG: hypothetical protein IPN29_15480 [Saprospiraceae bacterium]|nr:hypothetical protein [Saprospiraceae bacterium]